MFLVAVNPILAKPGESKGKQKERYDVRFTGEITGGPETAGVVNQWSMGIYGTDSITLTFEGFDGSGELGLHTKDNGVTVQMNFGFKVEGDRHAHVLEATSIKIVGDWMANSFSIVFADASIWYKKSLVWSGKLHFIIDCKVPA